MVEKKKLLAFFLHKKKPMVLLYFVESFATQQNSTRTCCIFKCLLWTFLRVYFNTPKDNAFHISLYVCDHKIQMRALIYVQATVKLVKKFAECVCILHQNDELKSHFTIYWYMPSHQVIQIFLFHSTFLCFFFLWIFKEGKKTAWRIFFSKVIWLVRRICISHLY